VFFGLAAVAIVAGVAWALLGSRLLVVRSVQVTGTGPQVSRAQVLAAARVPAGLPLIRVNTAAVAQRVGGIRQELAVHGRDLGPAPDPGLRGRGARRVRAGGRLRRGRAGLGAPPAATAPAPADRWDRWDRWGRWALIAALGGQGRRGGPA
jgi:hypothetical protein